MTRKMIAGRTKAHVEGGDGTGQNAAAPLVVRGRLRHGWWGVLAGLLALAVALVADSTASPWVGLAAALVSGVALLLVVARLVRRGIRADSDGITLMNFGRDRWLSWDDVTGIDFMGAQNELGITLYYRLWFETGPDSGFGAQAPGGGARPGQYLHGLRERLYALRDASPRRPRPTREGPSPADNPVPRTVGFEPHPQDHRTTQAQPSDLPPDAAGSALRAVAYGTSGALLGSAAYAAFVTLTQREVVVASVVLGVVVGLSVRLAQSSLRPAWTSAISVLLTLLGLLLSEYLVLRQLGGLAGAPMLLPAGDLARILRAGLGEDPMTLLFWGITLVAAATTGHGRSGTDLEPPDDDDVPPDDDPLWPGLVRWRHWTATFAAAFLAGSAAVLVLGTVPLTGDAVSANVPGLSVGHCYNETHIGWDAPQEVPCSEPHNEEVFHIFTLDSGPFPGDAAVEEAGDQTCGDELQHYAGDHSTQYDFSYYYPDQDSWNLGDHVITCILARSAGSDLETLYGTKLRGSARTTTP